jgi:hypothetical protein
VTEGRPKITPRLILVHTNGASGTGSIASAFSWSMRDPNYTKPHYQVDMDGSAAKFLPSDRKGIGNGTVTSKTGGKAAADFSLVIETADPGYGAGKPGQDGGFTPAQVETVAQIIAYEAKLWNIPIEYPGTWDGSGVACHTEPFGYPYWTIDAGHVCPGRQKKLEMVSLVLPRARAILAGPTPLPPPVPQEDDHMYIAHLSDGTAVVVGSSVRPISGGEQEGPYANLPHYTPDPNSYWHMWIRAGVDEYARRLGMA